MLLQPEVSDFGIESVCNLVNADERHIEKIVAAEKNLQNRMDKQGQYTNSLLILIPYIFL